MRNLILTFIGIDEWSRPVYRGDDNNLYCDVDDRSATGDIHSKCNNDFDGEPDWPVAPHVELEFVPYRVVGNYNVDS